MYFQNMNLVYILYYILLGISVTSGISSIKIRGGNDAEDKYPYQVSIQYDEKHACGGSIINENFVLTAAHCILSDYTHNENYSNMSILTGALQLSKGGVHYKIDKIIQHPLYSYEHEYDIALIRVNKPIQFDDHTKQIELATENPKHWTIATITGWGLTSILRLAQPDHLQVLETKIITPLSCNNSKKDKIYTWNLPLKGLYPGDSGSPVVANEKQVGIVSTGVLLPIGIPYTHTSVAHYYEWITENVKF